MRTRTLAVLASVAAAACSPAQQQWVDGVGLTLAEAAVACDWGGTRRAASDEWTHNEERGGARLILGPYPQTGAIDSYFLVAGFVLLHATRLVPLRWRPVVHAAVLVMEAPALNTNAHANLGTCGIR